MKLTLTKLGGLGNAVIEPHPLTILVGGNNTGKTYAMYVLWNVLQRRFGSGDAAWSREIADRLSAEGTLTLRLADLFSDHLQQLETVIAKGTTQRLPSLFSGSDALFSEAKVQLSLGPVEELLNSIRLVLGNPLYRNQLEESDSRLVDARFNSKDLSIQLTQTKKTVPKELVASFVFKIIAELALSPYANECFLMPAERGGLNIFAADLDAKNAALLRHMKRDELNLGELLKDVMVAQYAEPIDAYLRFLRRLPRAAKGDTEFHDEAVRLQKQISRVRYRVSKEGLITALPYRSDAELGIHMASSTVKSFYGLWGYLEAFASANDCLMIDEPELNLHPDNQRLVARLLARLVRRGIRVVISTHSDYMIREFNNLIMLSQEFDGKDEIAKRYGYSSDDRLNQGQVAAYHFTASSCTRVEVDPRYGIPVESMDEVMNSLNESSSELFFALEEKLAATPLVDSVSAKGVKRNKRQVKK